MTGAIVAENLWRAQRDGVRATFIDETSGSAIPCAEYLASVLEQLALDATELNCVPEADRTSRFRHQRGSSTENPGKIANDYNCCSRRCSTGGGLDR
jgi:gamma-glutamyl:cysteine ligase YbdK (ATP-grasp superfamily)